MEYGDKKEYCQIRKNQWLTNIELEEIQRRMEDEPPGHVLNDSGSED